MTPEICIFNAPNPKGLFRKASTHRLNYYVWGKDSDPVVLCIHGMARNGRDFDYLAKALVQKNYRVIAVDIAGRGLSEHLSNPKHYGYALYCADVIALIKELKLKDINFIGTSMGGLIGMMIAAKPKQKKLIKKLILNDIGYFIPKESLMRIGTYIGKNMEFADKESAQKYYHEIMASFGVDEDEHFNHLFEHGFIKRDDGSYHFVYDKNISNAFWTKKGKQKKLPDMNFKLMWKLLKCPIYLLRGKESDLLTKETFDEMKKSKNVKGSIEFDNIGHAPMLMNDEQISIIQKYLSLPNDG